MPTEAIDELKESGADEAGRQLAYLLRMGQSFSGHERNVCHLNLRDGSFANVSAVSGLDFPDDGRAVCQTDWDADGRIDLWLANRSGPQVRFLRNAGAAGGWVRLRLVGQGANRDAIGARVEVRTAAAGGDLPPLFRTLGAGSGFLSQSSKWLHFGLGDAREIAGVTVQWPRGEREAFAGVQAGASWVLTQGTGKALPWTAPPAPKLEPSTLPETPATGRSRVFLSTRSSVPDLPYRDPAGNERVARPADGRPLLVNLWSASCRTCVTELADFAAHADALKAANLDVRVLAVDDAPTEGVLPPAFPFPVGRAGQAALDAIDHVVGDVFRRPRPLPVPTSILLDPSGNLAAIYRGPLDFARLAEDVAALPLDAVGRRDRAVPFAGRWYALPSAGPFRVLARRFLDEGRFDLAGHMAATVLQEHPDDAEAHYTLGCVLESQGTHAQALAQFEAALASEPGHAQACVRSGRLLASMGRAREALERFDRALRLDPHSAAAMFGRGVAFETAGHLPEALDAYSAALAEDPGHSAAGIHRGRALLGLRRVEEAEAHFRTLLERRPEWAEARFNHALALVNLRRPGEAVEEYHRARGLEPHNADIRFGLAWALIAQDRKEEAAAEFREVLRLRPDHPRAADVRAALERLGAGRK